MFKYVNILKLLKSSAVNPSNKTASQITVSKEFILNNKAITISNFVYELDALKIYTNKYSYVEIQGQKTELLAITDKHEFYNDILSQLNVLQNKKLVDRDFLEALIAACAQHIEKFRRLIITDMHGYLNCTMHLVDASNKVFHNHIKNEEENIELRKFYEHCCIEILSEYIWVPDPLGGMENGMSKIIPYKEAQRIKNS